MSNQVKKRFVILNKIFKKLLPEQKKHIAFMFDSIQREMEYQLRKTAEQRKKKKPV